MPHKDPEAAKTYFKEYEKRRPLRDTKQKAVYWKQYYAKKRVLILAKDRDRQRHLKKSSAKKKSEHLKYKFGLTLEEYAQRVTEQNGVCAICFKPETLTVAKTEVPKQLSVDHNHQTQEIRGLLCGRCNTALGLMFDDTSILLSAVRYLERHRK